MFKIAKEIISSCEICSKAKYGRHPQRQKIAETQIPAEVGQILHIDIFSTDKKYFLRCINKFSKFAVIQPIESKTISDVKRTILQLINFFRKVETIFCDNEKSLSPLHSSSNGQIERLHSTIGEIARCIKLERRIIDTTELIQLATN